MKKLKPVLAFFYVWFAVYAFSSCERDDICAEDSPTTPFLIIKFIDFETRFEAKKPVELVIKPTDTTFKDSIFFATDVDSIAIPLRTDKMSTSYQFIINGDPSDDDDRILNIDTLEFQYTPVEEYLSSACGFRANFRGITATLRSDDGENNGDSDLWIKDFSIEANDVINESTTHFSIFH